MVAKIALLPPPLFWLAGIRNFPLAGLAQGGEEGREGLCEFHIRVRHSRRGGKEEGGERERVDGGRLAGLA